MLILCVKLKTLVMLSKVPQRLAEVLGSQSENSPDKHFLVIGGISQHSLL